MLPDSHYDKDKADRAVAFIENLCHTKGKWAGQPFLLLPWQEQIVRDLFGIVKENGQAAVPDGLYRDSKEERKERAGCRYRFVPSLCR
jgi:hypothetical protein